MAIGRSQIPQQIYGKLRGAKPSRAMMAAKRAAGNTGPKPTFVKTFTKKYYGDMISTGD
jgi:hypothetical protein